MDRTNWQYGRQHINYLVDPLSGKAVARALFGDVSPSGKLPMSVPRSTGQVPIYYGSKPIGKMRAYQEYLPYKDQEAAPLYPFGFGLTYSS